MSTSLSQFMSAFSIVAIVLNTILLPLIALRSNKEIGSYKHLLFCYTLIAVVYTVITLIMVPMFEPCEQGWLFYATIQRVPQELGSWLICLFSTCYVKLLMILTYSFVYRYFVICRPEALRWFREPFRVFLIVLLYFLIILLCAGPVCYVMRMNKEIAKNLEGANVIDLTGRSYIGAPMFRNGYLVPETTFILSVWTFVIGTSSTVILFCIVRMIQMFRQCEATADWKLNSIQMRLFILLILQTIVPLVFTFIPCLLSYALAYAGIHAPFISQASSALMPLAQCVDPILIFGFIGEYRRALWRVIKEKVFGAKIVSSAVYSETLRTGSTTKKQQPVNQLSTIGNE